MIIYPEYLDKQLSLNEGRKIALDKSVKEPTVNDIAKALGKLGISHVVEKNKNFPGKWYSKRGRVIAECEDNKLELLGKVGLKIQEFKQ